MGGNARAHRIGDSRIPTAHKTGVGYADESKQYQPFQLGFFIIIIIIILLPSPLQSRSKNGGYF